MSDKKIVSAPEKYSTVAGVVADELCHSCGVCAGICPRDAIEFDSDARPVVTDCCNACGLCLQVCSGWQGEVERAGPEEREAAYLAASSDEPLRLRSSSGGLVTELLRFLLASGRVQCALVTVSDPRNPARPISVLAETEEELLRSCQSRYALFPWGRTVKELLRRKQPFAVVGTSCQLASFHNVVRLFPKITKYLVMTIGICCESNVEPAATDHLLRIRRVDRDNLHRIEFRSGKWPGVMNAFVSDGREVILSNRNRLEGAINYLKLCYGRNRCFYCSDVMCENADITVGDPWGRNEQGHLIYKGSDGYSAALVRGSAVEGVLREMQSRELIHLEEQPVEDILNVQLRQVVKKRLKIQRAAVSAEKSGQPYPKNIEIGPKDNKGLSFTEKCVRTAENLAHYEPFRSLLMRFFFSSAGDVFTRLNALLKQRKSEKRQSAARH